MAVRPVLALPDPFLQRPSATVGTIDDTAVALATDLLDTMRSRPACVGLAAPQIGVPLRIAVVEAEQDELYVIVNPEIVESEGEHILDEGCLSVPGYWGKVTRAEKVTVKARDAHGKEIRIAAAEGLLGQALQHEIDHLNGMVYVDRLDRLDELQRTARRPHRRSTDEQPAEPAEPE